MYFRLIITEQTELYATNSSGAAVAIARKLDFNNPNSWTVITGPTENEIVHITGKTMEEAVDWIVVNL